MLKVPLLPILTPLGNADLILRFSPGPPDLQVLFPTRLPFFSALPIALSDKKLRNNLPLIPFAGGAAGAEVNYQPFEAAGAALAARFASGMLTNPIDVPWTGQADGLETADFRLGTEGIAAGILGLGWQGLTVQNPGIFSLIDGQNFQVGFELSGGDQLMPSGGIRFGQFPQGFDADSFHLF
jgi:hypothetical protein